MPIYAVGINMPTMMKIKSSTTGKYISKPLPPDKMPKALLRDLAGGQDTFTDIRDWDKLDDFVADMLAKLCTIKAPAPAPSPAPSPSPPPPVPGKKCAKPIDLVFVVDQSGSIEQQCEQDTRQACWPKCPKHKTCWPAMKNFIDRTQKKFDVGAGKLQSRVSLVTFGREAATAFNFKEHQSNAAVSNAVQGLEYSRCLTKNADGSEKLFAGTKKCGWPSTPVSSDKCCDRDVSTRTRLAFEAIEKDIFTTAGGVRPASDKVTRVVVVLTDGVPTNGYSPAAAAKKLREAGAGAIVIGVGVNLDTQPIVSEGVTTTAHKLLADMVGPGGPPVITASNFADLSSKILSVANTICTKAGGAALAQAQSGSLSGSVLSFSTSGGDGGGSDPDFAFGCSIPGSSTGRRRRDGAGGCSGPDIVDVDGLSVAERTCMGAADGYGWSLAISATLKLAARKFTADPAQLQLKGAGAGGVLLPGTADALAIDAAQLAKVTTSLFPTLFLFSSLPPVLPPSRPPSRDEAKMWRMPVLARALSGHGALGRRHAGYPLMATPPCKLPSLTTTPSADVPRQVTNDALRLRGELGFRVRGRGMPCFKNLEGRFYFGLVEGHALMNAFGSKLVHVADFSVEAKFKGSFPYLTSIKADGGFYLGEYGRAARCHLLSQDTDCTRVLHLGASFAYEQLADGKLRFLLSTGLRASGQTAQGFALLDLYNAVSPVPMTASVRKWLALLSSVDFDIAITLVLDKGKALDVLSLDVSGELHGKNLPPLNAGDDVIDGNCNVVCEYLHRVLGSTGSAQLGGTIAFNGKTNAVSAALTADITGASLPLKVGGTDVTLVNLGLAVSFTSAGSFKMALTADIDVEDNLKLTGGVGFEVVKGVAAARFSFGLRAPYYSAFGSAMAHVTAFDFNIELKGKFPFVSKLEASGELCVGQLDACKACAEADVPQGSFRSLLPVCQGPLYVDVLIRISLPGQAKAGAGDTCAASASGKGGWELYVEASVEAANGKGPLSRIQAAVAGKDSNGAVDDRLGVFAAVKFTLSLTLGPKRVEIAAEARLHKVALPPRTKDATSKTCDMVCQMCHDLLGNASPGSYIFVRGEVSATVKPFSLKVAIGAGFGGRIEYPKQGVTLTEAGITFTFTMAPSALEFEAKVYGAIELEQKKSFGASDGVVVASSGAVTFKDPDTGSVYGTCSKEAFAGFSKPLRLTGEFAIGVGQGRIDGCGKSTPGQPVVRARIGFGMQGWNMKVMRFKYLHVGNLAFDLAIVSNPPYFESFTGQTEVCFGVLGRCAKCLLGTNANDCQRTIYAATYLGVGTNKFFVRAELYSRVSLKGLLQVRHLKRSSSVFRGCIVLDFVRLTARAKGPHGARVRRAERNRIGRRSCVIVRRCRRSTWTRSWATSPTSSTSSSSGLGLGSAQPCSATRPRPRCARLYSTALYRIDGVGQGQHWHSTV